MSCAVLPPAPSDYSAVSQEVVFPAGTTQRSVAIPIMEDSVLEATEFFLVSISIQGGSDGVVLRVDSVEVSIQNNDSEFAIAMAINPIMLFSETCIHSGGIEVHS